MIEYLEVILFGIVEGVTEWLPISSTGHMIILNEFIKLNVTNSFYSVFEVVIQLGAIIAVIVLFFDKIFPFEVETVAHGGEFKKNLLIKRSIVKLWINILISCIPAAIIGILFDDVFEELFYNYTSVAIALIVFGVAFIIIENINAKRRVSIKSLDQITIKTAAIIGLFQLIAAIFPGTSRSGATILGALLIGVSRSVAAEYTFYLAIPVMLGASLLRILKYGIVFTGEEVLMLFLGTITAFITSVVAIRFLMSFVKKYNFKIFGIYRIVLGALVLLMGLFK